MQKKINKNKIMLSGNTIHTLDLVSFLSFPLKPSSGPISSGYPCKEIMLDAAVFQFRLMILIVSPDQTYLFER
jgi:hypothetical protein